MAKQSIVFLLLSLLFISADNLDQPYNRIGYEQEGNASYYADKFHGRKTANGEIYDMSEMTAAHPRIRFNTKIKVTNLNNDKTIIVRVNDRGPYSGGRIIDLSKAAAQKLDMIRYGVIPVKTEVVDVEGFPVFVKKEEKIELEKTKETTTKEKEADISKTKEQTTKKKTKVGRLLDKVFNKKQQEKPKNSTEGNKESTEKQAIKTAEEKPVVVVENKTSTNKPKGGVIDKPQQQVKSKSNEEKFAGVNTYSLWGTIKYPDGFGVQIASYSLLDKALEKAKLVYEKGFKDVFIQTGWAGDKRIFRILVGEGSSETVSAMLPKLKQVGYSGFVKQHY
jgi:rare lipoprotein A